MVPVFLIQKLQRAANLILQHPRAAVGVLATGSLAVVLLSGVALDRSKQSHAGDRPSLMQLLQQLETEKTRSQYRCFSPSGHHAQGRGRPPWRGSARGLIRLCANDWKHKRTSGSWRTTVPIHPTNYGECHSKDANDAPLDSSPRVVVMHETVYSLTSAINTFQTPHPRDENQASYHTLVGLDGTVVDVVDPLSIVLMELAIPRSLGNGLTPFHA